MTQAAAANRRYFRQAYETGRHGWGVEQPSPYAVGFLKQLKRWIPGGALLDIGCGEGRHAIAAAQLGFKVTAIDYEPLALKRARRFAAARGAKGILFRQGNALDLPFRDARFDAVLDYGCLHHQKKSDWSAYRAGVLRVLKPQGYFILSVFTPRFRFFRGSGRSWHIAYGAYRRCFERKDIEGLLGAAFDFLELTEENGKSGGFWHALMRRRLTS